MPANEPLTQSEHDLLQHIYVYMYMYIHIELHNHMASEVSKKEYCNKQTVPNTTLVHFEP